LLEINVDVGLIAQLFIVACLLMQRAWHEFRWFLEMNAAILSGYGICLLQREPKSTLLCFAVLSLITSGLAGSLDSEMHDTANYDCIAYVTRGVPRGTRPSCHVTSLRRPGMA